jgi:hypothetical protein
VAFAADAPSVPCTDKHTIDGACIAEFVFPVNGEVPIFITARLRPKVGTKISFEANAQKMPKVLCREHNTTEGWCYADYKFNKETVRVYAIRIKVHKGYVCDGIRMREGEICNHTVWRILPKYNG